MDLRSAKKEVDTSDFFFDSVKRIIGVKCARNDRTAVNESGQSDISNEPASIRKIMWGEGRE